MGGLGQYIFRLSAGAVICGIIMGIVQDGSYRSLMQMICGLFLMVLLISPLTDIQWDPDFRFFQEHLQTGKDQASTGEAMARNEQMLCITEAVEAYILDKAAGEGAALTVKVTLGEDLLPAFVEMRGNLTHQAKRNLSDIMERELGIAKENQLWTG